MRDEMRQFEAPGIACVALEPDERDREAFGPNMMDPSRSAPARAAGRERGRQEADSPLLTAFRA